MSARSACASDAAASAASRDKSLLHLLDPTDMMPGHTTADLYSLRHLTLRGGLPDSPSWLRAQAWKVLLGYLPPEKKEWPATLAKRRKEYYQFVSDFAPVTEGLDAYNTFSDKDVMLDQIYKDLSRSRKNGFAFYQGVPKSSSSCPVSPLPKAATSLSNDASAQTSTSSVKRLDNRHQLLVRLAQTNRDFAQSLNKHRDPHRHSSAQQVQPLLSPAKSPPILLSPPSPGSRSRNSSQHSFTSADDGADAISLSAAAHDMSLQEATTSQTQTNLTDASGLEDRNWHSLLRILYLFALLNPSIGYVQGMNEALFTFVYVFATATYPIQDTLHPSHSAQIGLNDASDSHAVDTWRDWNNESDLSDLDSHAEADAFWCFSSLIGEVRELYEFDELARNTVSNSTSTGMAGILAKFSLRLKWLDRDFWSDLRSYNLDPRLPYYSVRWLACMLCTELSQPSLTRVWDAVLAEQGQGSTSTSAKVDFLVDVSCAMLLHVKDRLPHAPEDPEQEREAFSYGMRFLQSYPEDDISPVLELATLFRQRRMAAELTGDGPPCDDEEDASTPTSVKDRATKALRQWINTTTSRTGTPPQPHTPNTSRWFGAFSREEVTDAEHETPDMSFESNPGDVSVASTSSKVSFSGMFAKYADAVQRSDAAASLSKTSTNLTAKAMARFADRSSRESTPESRRPAMIKQYSDYRVVSSGSVSASIFNKSRRTVSSSASASAGPNSPLTPDLHRWSEGTMPHFPLPNVSDSPAGRMEYVDTAGKRISTMPGLRSNSMHESPNFPEERTGSMSMLPLPSMRAAAKLGLLSQQSDTGYAGARTAGPKPLLLSQSARPPREVSNGSGLLLEEPSRKVSSGPMAQSMSRGNSYQDGRSSIADSLSGRSSRSVSNADSRRSSAGSPNVGMSGFEQAGELPPLPSLMSQRVETSSPALIQGRPSNGREVVIGARKHSAGSMGLQGLASAEGKAPAGAFGRPGRSAATPEVETVRPTFGQISSSSDVPLVTAGSTNISRPRLHNRKRISGSTIGSRSASISESVIEQRLSHHFSTSANADGLFEYNGLVSGRDNDSGVTSAEPNIIDTVARPVPERTWSIGEAVHLQDMPMTEFAAESMAMPESQGYAQRYVLVDEPLPNTEEGHKQTEQVRLPPTNTSSVGISRSKRLGKSRTGSSSSVASRRSLASIGAGLRRSSRTSVHEQAPSSPAPLPDLAEDTNTPSDKTGQPDRPTSGNMTYSFDSRSVYPADADYEDEQKPARPSLDSYISAADQYVHSSASH